MTVGVEQTRKYGFALQVNRKIRLNGSWLARVDASGVLWERYFPSVANLWGLGGLEALPTGGFALAGSMISETTWNQEAVLVRLDDDGAVLWMKQPGAWETSWAGALAVTPSGGLLVAGMKWEVVVGLSEQAWFWRPNCVD